MLAGRGSRPVRKPCPQTRPRDVRDLAQHTFQILFDLVVPKTQHTEASCVQPEGATRIERRPQRVLAPIEELSANAKQAVVVTSEPPREVYDSDPERVQEFQTQIGKMKKYNITVKQVKVPPVPSEAEDSLPDDPGQPPT